MSLVQPTADSVGRKSAVMSYQPDPEKSAGNGSLVSLFLRLQEVITFPANEESATLVIVAALLSSEPGRDGGTLVN